MKDQLVRAMTKDGFVNAVAVTTTGIVERARQIHKTLPTATAALGRLLTAASMMGNMQKVDDGSITLQLKAGGPLGRPTPKATSAAGSKTHRSPCWRRPPASLTSARPSAPTARSPSSVTFA